MGFRLRYLAQDLALPVGTFVIGRAQECDLALDDPMVSRRHAQLDVRPDVVSIEDLGSRNGVIVGGQRIDGRRELASGEQVVIGSQEMTVYRADDARAHTPEGRLATQTLGGAQIVRVHDDATSDGELVFEPTMNAAPTEFAPTPSSRALQTLTLLSGVADKAAALGRHEDAERVLNAVLTDVVQRAAAGGDVEADLAEAAALRAIKLATTTTKGAWFDYVVRLYASLSRLAPANVVDELHGAVRRVKSVDLALMRAYVAAMKADPGHSPRDRFVVQRLEGLAKLAALK